jgi:predicted enzyme related to lactoylglutathione lyase
MLDLDAAILYTNNIAVIRTFYEETVGLTFDHQDGDQYVSFVFPNGAKLGINKSVLTDREKPGGQTVFIRTSDILVQKEKYEKLRYSFYEPYTEETWGKYFAILDPDGNKIGFISPVKAH